jgi:hypothetical protein
MGAGFWARLMGADAFLPMRPQSFLIAVNVW